MTLLTRPDLPWPPTDPFTAIAATAWMEDQSGLEPGMQAVMNVVCNRARNARWWGHDILSVCMMPYQFSCWMNGSLQRNCRAAMNNGDPYYAISAKLAALAVKDNLPDLTGNADSYYASSDPNPPAWAEHADYCGEIGGQRFYRLYLHPVPVVPTYATPGTVLLASGTSTTS